MSATRVACSESRQLLQLRHWEELAVTVGAQWLVIVIGVAVLPPECRGAACCMGFALSGC